MTKPKTEVNCAMGPFWKVRIGMSGGPAVHVASRTEPVVIALCSGPGSVMGIEMDLIAGTEHGDTIGFIDYSAVTSVTWRKA